MVSFMPRLPLVIGWTAFSAYRSVFYGRRHTERTEPRRDEQKDEWVIYTIRIFRCLLPDI